METSVIKVECAQGTPDWFQARSGATTASTFSDAVSVLKKNLGDKKVGDPTDKALQLAAESAIELITGKPYGDTFATYAMRRGTEEEWKAREAYQQKTGEEVDESGVYLTSDRAFGYSSDGQVVGFKGGIEIKTPLNGLKLLRMLESGDTGEYEHQIQGGMWVCGWEWVDYVMWMPELHAVNGNGLYVKRIHRDDNFIDDMVKRLLAHREEVMRCKAIFSTNMDLLAAQGIAAVRFDDVIDVPSRIVTPAKELAKPAHGPIVAAALAGAAAKLAPPDDKLANIF